MIYVYDSVMEPFVETFKRYGATYKLENRTRMGDQVFFMFHSPGREKILVVPRFAKQYREAEQLFGKFSHLKSLDACVKHIKRTISKEIFMEEIPSDESETGMMDIVNVDYKDIRIQFQFFNNHMQLGSEFEILDHNIFGNGIVVTMNMNMEGSV